MASLNRRVRHAHHGAWDAPYQYAAPARSIY